MKTKLQSLLFLGLVMLAAWLPASSFGAGAIPAPNTFERFMWNIQGGTAESTQVLNFGGSGKNAGTPILSPLVPQIDTDGGLPRVSTGGQLSNPSGRPYPITATGRVSGLATAKAVGRVALGFTGFLGVGVALYDLFKELGYDAVRLPDGTIQPKKYSMVLGCTLGGNFADPAEWCAGNYYVFDELLDAGSDASFCRLRISCRNVNGKQLLSNVGVFQRRLTGSALVDVPMQQFLDDVASRAGWPTTSSISRVLADPLASSGEKVQVDPQSIKVDGPATTPGAVETKREVRPDGSTVGTTKTTTHNHTYEGAKVTTNTTTVTNVTTCVASGSCSTTTETAKTDPIPGVPAEAPITCGLPDTPICAVKVDESGTEKPVTDTQFNPKAEALKSPKEQALERMKGTTDTSTLFSGWNVFWNVPPLVACEPFVLPERGGVSMGSIDACNVVEGMRTVMAYIWAVAGLFLCVSMIRETIQGG